jgi:hypothetical protein
MLALIIQTLTETLSSSIIGYLGTAAVAARTWLAVGSRSKVLKTTCGVIVTAALLVIKLCDGTLNVQQDLGGYVTLGVQLVLQVAASWLTAHYADWLAKAKAAAKAAQAGQSVAKP